MSGEPLVLYCIVLKVRFWLCDLQDSSFAKKGSPLFSIFSLAAIFAGSRDHRTQFWKGVTIGPVVSEEKIKM
jgi:hypothetical protein